MWGWAPDPGLSTPGIPCGSAFHGLSHSQDSGWDTLRANAEGGRSTSSKCLPKICPSVVLHCIFLWHLPSTIICSLELEALQPLAARSCKQSHSAGTSGRPFYTHFLVYTKSVLVEQSTPVFLTLEEAAVDAHADSVHVRSMHTCSRAFVEYMRRVLCMIPIFVWFVALNSVLQTNMPKAPGDCIRIQEIDIPCAHTAWQEALRAPCIAGHTESPDFRSEKV